MTRATTTDRCGVDSLLGVMMMMVMVMIIVTIDVGPVERCEREVLRWRVGTDFLPAFFSRLMQKEMGTSNSIWAAATVAAAKSCLAKELRILVMVLPGYCT